MKGFSMDELLDLVDQSDNVIGSSLRSIVYEKGLSNFRVINCFLKNSNGELWIPRRTAQKRVFPLCLDVSMGGHVSSGESYEEAFMRELDEELNIKAHEISFNEVGYFTPHEHKVSAFMKVYEIITDVSPLYNPNDFIKAEWLKPAVVIERLSGGDKGKGDLPTLIKLLYDLNLS